MRNRSTKRQKSVMAVVYLLIPAFKGPPCLDGQPLAHQRKKED